MSYDETEAAVLNAFAEVVGLGVLERPRDILDFYDALNERFWDRFVEEIRPGLEERLRQELQHFHAQLSESVNSELRAQLDDAAGVRAVELARDVIVARLKADRPLWREYSKAPPQKGGRRWFRRRNRRGGPPPSSRGMMGLG